MKGIRKHKLYGVWSQMKARCSRKNHPFYKYYGGRGICVCHEWVNNYPAFYEWSIGRWGEGLEIDRMNNDSGYSPDNCRFVTHLVNMHNRPPYSTSPTRKQTSKYIGVHYSDGRFRAQVHLDSKITRLGSFKDELSAVTARDKFIIDNGLDVPLQVFFGP